MAKMQLMCALSAALSLVSLAQSPNDTAIVFNHVATNASMTQQQAKGFLKFPYLIPGGYYQQLWDCAYPVLLYDW